MLLAASKKFDEPDFDEDMRTMISLLYPSDKEAPVGSKVYLDVDNPFDEKQPALGKSSSLSTFLDQDETPWRVIKRLRMDKKNRLVYSDNEYLVQTFKKDITTDYDMDNATVPLLL